MPSSTEADVANDNVHLLVLLLPLLPLTPPRPQPSAPWGTGLPLTLLSHDDGCSITMPTLANGTVVVAGATVGALAEAKAPTVVADACRLKADRGDAGCGCACDDDDGGRNGAPWGGEVFGLGPVVRKACGGADRAQLSGAVWVRTIPPGGGL
jgi:hypothetical protein